MQSSGIRKKFLDFFRKKGHKIMPSSSLIPEDETVLFTTAGMQQFSPYLSGKQDPIEKFGTRHLASCQKCFRTKDIAKVGDTTHHTFFEMLGNWSIGQDFQKGYFKEGAIRYALDFFINEFGFNKDKIEITVFRGEKDIPPDGESFKIWQENGIPEEKIKSFGMEENFWGPVGERQGPCGPSSEIYYNGFELWNLVFMEYYKNEDGTYAKLPQKNIDTGIGFERLVAALQKKESAYETDLFLPIIHSLERNSQKKYHEGKKLFRIIADHLRGSVFLISERILPSNLDRGYILRRILRRCIRYAKILRLKDNWYIELVKKVIEIYKNIYPEIEASEEKIITVIKNEEEKFGKALDKSEELLVKIRNEVDKFRAEGKDISERTQLGKRWWGKKYSIEKIGELAFNLYQTMGTPPEITYDYFEDLVSEEEFHNAFADAFQKHQKLSKASAKKKFKGGLIDQSYETTKLHAATHLLLQALREVLGVHVYQKGSNITPERLRFDFPHPEKLTKGQIKKIEDLVNRKIKEKLSVTFKEMSLDEAKKEGAIGVFEEKYSDRVKVYKIGDFSREICGGPHIKNTGELGKFKIQKEESIGAGKRRIKAVLI